MNKYISLFLCFYLLLIGCRKDEFSENIVETGPTTAVVVGLVVDEAGTAVPGAEVRLAGTNMLTDVNGYFKFKTGELDEAGSVLKVSKNGFFENYKFVYTEKRTQSYVQVTLVTAEVTGSFQAADTGEITDPSGAKISFPANAISKDGAAYNGQVIVRSHWYDPSNENLASTMPGDLRGINNQNERVQLATLGMMAVELSTIDGSELQLTEGKTATLTFPLTEEMAQAVTSEIPMWSLNENTGVWIEEGSASLIGNSMVAEVNHFSFWNCDFSFPLVEIYGRLETNSGDPVPNQRVSIRVKDSFLTGYGITNCFGIFKGKVPKDEPLELIVSHCGVTIIEEDLGVLSADQDLGSFLTVFTDFERPLTGRLLDCADNPLADAYVIIRSLSTTEILVPDADGNISGVVKGCGTDGAVLKAFDPINIIESAPMTVAANNNPLNLGDWVVCEERTERFIYSIDGGSNNLISEARVSLVDNELIHISANDVSTGFTFDTQVKLTDVGKAPSLKTYIRGFDANSEIVFAYCGSDYRNSGIICEDLEITITEIGTVGELLVGTITGNVDGKVIEASFQVYLDEAFDTGRVEGRVWNDANENGIQDPSEIPLSGIRIDHQKELVRFYPVNREANTSDADGNYYLDGLVPGEYYLVGKSFSQSADEYGVTIAGQGDETSDCDFILDNNSFNRYVYEILEFTDTGLESNIDLGLIINGIICNVQPYGCGPDAYIRVTPSGGVPPYTIVLDGVTTMPPGETIFPNVSPGDHTVTVSDQSGLMCSDDDHVREFQNSIHVQVWQDLAGGIPNVFDEATGQTDVSGISIELYKDGSLFRTKTSDSNGRAYFGSIGAGIYKVTMTAPNNFEYVTNGVGSDEEKDSDMDLLTNFTGEESFSTNCDNDGRFTIGIRKI